MRQMKTPIKRGGGITMRAMLLRSLCAIGAEESLTRTTAPARRKSPDNLGRQKAPPAGPRQRGLLEPWAQEMTCRRQASSGVSRAACGGSRSGTDKWNGRMPDTRARPQGTASVNGKIIHVGGFSPPRCTPIRRAVVLLKRSRRNLEGAQPHEGAAASGRGPLLDGKVQP